MRYFENPNDSNNVYGYDSQDKTQAELLALAISGGWKELTGNWPPAPTLQEERASVWGNIKTKRTTIELGGVKVGAKWYHTDDASRIKYLGLFKMAEQVLAAGGTGATVLQYGGVDIRWKTMDGTFVNMTAQLAQDVYFAVIGLDFSAFAAAETHRVAMEAAADPAAYDFSAGWPASFPVA